MPVLAGLLGVLAFSFYDLLLRALGHQVSPSVILISVTCALLIISFGRLCIMGKGFFPSNFWGWPALLGIAKALNVVCAVMTFRNLSVAEGFILIFTYPIWAVVLDAIIKRRFFKRYMVPLALAVIGLLFVYCSRDAHFTLNLGVVWGLLTAFLCASNILLARQLQHESLFKLSFSSALFCLIVGLAGLVIGHAPEVSPLPSVYWQLSVLIVCSVCGSLGALFAAQKLPPVRSALLCYLQIPVAVFFAWLCMGEAITIQMAVGLFLIVAGSLTAQLQKSPVQPAA